MSSELKTRRRILRTVGGRLTVQGAAVTFAVCAFLCAGLYLGVSFSLQREVDNFLMGEVHEFVRTVNQYPDDVTGLERAIRDELGSRTQQDLAFRFFDDTGVVTATSEPDDGVGRLWRAPEDWSASPPHFEFCTLWPEGAAYPYRACSLLVTTADGQVGTAQASYRLNHTYQSLALFRRVCAAGLGLAVALALISGHLMARRSLRPIRALTETAERISALQLAERVATVGSGDELDQLAATINRMLDRIEQHVTQVQRFTADASHELRSPLAALRGSAEVALSGTPSAEELRRVIEEAIEHYDHLTRTAEALLLLARADAGHRILDCEPVRLDSAVADVVDLYTPLAQERQVELAFDPREEIELEADGSRMRQLVGNLVDNAVKFTGEGGRVTVSLACTNGVARLSVSDTGEGIPPEHVERVFDRFYRVDQARSARNRGAGLGLAICRTIAEAHGGSIAISSTPGAGTSVTVTLLLDARSAT